MLLQIYLSNITSSEFSYPLLEFYFINFFLYLWVTAREKIKPYCRSSCLNALLEEKSH